MISFALNELVVLTRVTADLQTLWRALWVGPLPWTAVAQLASTQRPARSSKNKTTASIRASTQEKQGYSMTYSTRIRKYTENTSTKRVGLGFYKEMRNPVAVL